MGDGKQALEAVQVAEYDMVLMDLQMPILVWVIISKILVIFSIYDFLFPF